MLKRIKNRFSFRKKSNSNLVKLNFTRGEQIRNQIIPTGIRTTEKAD